MRTDAALLKSSLAGNRKAFGRIVRRYQSLVCAVTYSGTGDLAASEDLAQETFLKAWQRLGSVREPVKLRQWLCAIARNLCTDWLRRRGRDVTHAAQPLDAAGALPSPGPTPAEHAVAGDEAALVWQAVQGIPETYRLPLVLYYREGQSVRRVARALDLSRTAVKQRLLRGRGLLKEHVASLVEGTLTRSAPGAAFSVAVMGALALTGGKGGTTAATAAGGITMWKAATATGIAAAALVGGGVVVQQLAEKQPPPPVVEPAPAKPRAERPVYADRLPPDVLALGEISDMLGVFPRNAAFVKRITGDDDEVDVDEGIRKIMKTTDPSTVDLTQPVHVVLHEYRSYRGNTPFVAVLTDAEAYKAAADPPLVPVEGVEGLFTQTEGQVTDFVGIVGDRLIRADEAATARSIMRSVAAGDVGRQRVFPDSDVGSLARMADALAQVPDDSWPSATMRRAFGIAAGPGGRPEPPWFAVVDALEDMAKRQVATLGCGITIGEDHLGINAQVGPVAGSPLAGVIYRYPEGGLDLLRHVPADSLLVLAAKLPDFDAMLPQPEPGQARLPMDAWAGALRMLGDEAALALGRTDEGAVRNLVLVRLRDTAATQQLMHGYAAFVQTALAMNPEITFVRREIEHGGRTVKVWDLGVPLPAGARGEVVARLAGKDMDFYECYLDDVLVLAYGDGMLDIVQQIIDGTVEALPDAERYAQATAEMPDAPAGVLYAAV